MRQEEPDHLSPAALFGDLPVLRLRMEYSVDDPELLPDYLGSSWRGVLGWQMQRLCCPFPRRTGCADCLIREQCPYFLLYALQSDRPGFRDAPRPYVLLPEPGASPGRQVLNITLMGRAVRAAPLIWKAVQEAERGGLGRERVGFQVHGWREERPGLGWVELPDNDGYRHLHGAGTLGAYMGTAPLLPWNVALDPPLRLRERGRNLAAMDWPFALAILARRLEMLAVIFSGAEPMGRETWVRLEAMFKEMRIRGGERIAWKDWSRYSNRQRKKVPMGGLVGSAHIVEAPPELWFWLRCASVVHVGKGAAMGLGRIAVHGADIGTSSSDGTINS